MNSILIDESQKNLKIMKINFIRINFFQISFFNMNHVAHLRYSFSQHIIILIRII